MGESAMPSDRPERWLPVVGYEGFYEVSDLGRIQTVPHVSHDGRHFRRRIRKPYYGAGKIHATIRLSRDGKVRTHVVHVLVARAFLGPCPDGMEVCHGPAGSSDNSLVNLSYGTRAKNNGSDKRRDGTLLVGTDLVNAKLADEVVRECRVRWAAGETQRSLAREFGVSKPTMSLVVRGLRWQHVPLPDAMEMPSRIKLTDETARECRERHAAGESVNSIAHRFGVARKTVKDVINGRRWKHVPFPGATKPPAA